ncbi:TonB-dependent receptor domain-containing protein [Aliidiomarina soli]|uniref:TonB-dependent receptor n=1 Tax=Aliidiomarina soli TaxID=1928574 RepID=A0A432WJA0_9GAMM|nr:TonB-dependent receptor [Aliidiomarina soli]RUO33844.1 hypothetical protein CWE14_05115 [Aliidiomarina soli]
MTNKRVRISVVISVSVATLFSIAANSETSQEEASSASNEKKLSSSSEIERILVTYSGIGQRNSGPATPMNILSGDELAHRRQGTLGETLEGLPGIHMDNFGGGASRPVIRGQTVPRIEILSDGAELFDASSASPDHAVTTDPLLLDAIEIVRGPVATLYGGSAMNGAINLIDSKIPKAFPENGATGAAELRYGVGDEEKSFAARSTVSLGQFAFHAEGATRDAENYNVPSDFGSDELADSFSENSSFSVGSSWITDKGYIGLAYTRQEAEYGLPGHSHEGGICHTHGLDLHCEEHNQYNNPFEGLDNSHTAYIDLRSERIDIRGDYDDLLPGFTHTRLRFSHTDYGHDEIDGDTLFSNYGNNAYEGRIELTHVPLLGFIGTFGIQYTESTFTGLNRTDPTDNRELLEYITENVGIFLSEQRSIGAFDLEMAIRQDWRKVTVPFNMYAAQSPEYWDFLIDLFGEDGIQMDIDNARTRHEDTYLPRKSNPFSASIAGTWNFDDDYSAALSLSRSQRSPSVRELYAQGNNLATNSLEGGLLRANTFSSEFPVYDDIIETANTINLTFRKKTGPTQFEIGLYSQDIDDYIFANLVEEETLESGALFRYLIYTPADVRFTGIDGQISHQIDSETLLTIFGDYVRTEMKDVNDNLPRISPGRLGARYDRNWGLLSASLEYYRTFDQDRVASYETETAGYNMVNVTLSYSVKRAEGQDLEFYIRGTNLTNELALAHTSFVKDQSPLRGRNLVLGARMKF